MDLISREALIAVLQKYKFGAITNETEREYTKDIMLDFVADQPTIDAVPVVRGEWGNNESGVLFPIYRCSECNGAALCKTKFCPNCGARMDGKKNEGR